MTRTAKRTSGFLAASLCAAVLSFLSSCGSEPEDTSTLKLGPEVRVRVVRSQEVLYHASGAVDLIRAADRRLLFRGELPQIVRVRAVQGKLEFGGRVIDHPLRVRYRSGSAPSSDVALAEGKAPAERSEQLATWLKSAPHAPGDGEPTFVVGAGPAGGGGRAPQRYRGGLEFRIDGDRVTVINELPLESYLRGVIANEIPAKYPVESVRAQCVASRTYALYSLQRSFPKVFYSTAQFQVYKGVAGEHPAVDRALLDTHGEVLTYASRLFRTYFHSTCGGQTASAYEIFDDVEIPPLAGGECGACDTKRFHRWEHVLDVRVVEQAMKKRWMQLGRDVGQLGKLRSVEATSLSRDGRVLYLRLVHEKGSFEWRGDRFRSAIESVESGTLLSAYFRIEAGTKAGTFLVRGRGFGHGVGLCQVGTGQLGRDGKSYREILARYYPHAEIRKQPY
ncbi:MAG: SpoIID/LytB domain-containing protein [Planctomycetota bacterium]